MVDYKTNIIKAIRKAMEEDPRKCLQALTVIRSYQVNDEFQTGSVYYRNNMGFTPADAKFLTSLCDTSSKKGSLSEKQTLWVHKLMPKYARQMFDHFESKHLIKKCTENSKFIVLEEALWAY